MQSLVIYDYITRDGGYGGIESVIDLQSFSDAADICDELDTVNFNKDGTPGSFSARKFNINGVIKADSSRGEVLAEFQKHIGGFIFFRAGEWFIRMGVLGSQLAVTDIGEEDVVDSLSVVEVPPVRGYVNRLSGSFVDPIAGYVPVSYGQLDSSDKSNVGGVVLGKKLDFLYANNRVQALRLATLYFNIYQKFIRASLKVDWRLADIVEGDVVRLRFSEAHKDKHFLVEKSSLDSVGGNVGLHLREWGNDIYDFVDEDVVDTIVTDSGREGRWLVVELPINLSVSQSISYSNKSAGNRVNVLFSWKAGGTFTEAFDIAINGKVVVTDIPLVVTEYLFEDVVYNIGEEETVFSVRGKNFYGARGSWADVSLVVGGVEGPPDILRGVSLGYDGIYGIFNWLKVESIQVLNAGSIHVRYSESDVEDVEEAWDDGSLRLVAVVSGDDTSLRLVFDKGFYYFRVFDSLDNFSDIVKFYNSQGLVPLGVFLDEHPSFLGLPNDFTLLDGCLLSSTNSNFFSVANIYDVSNIFAGNGGAIESIYYFNSHLSFDIAAERLMRSFVGYTIQGEVGIADFDLRVQFRSRAEKSQVFGDWADMQNDYTRYYFIEMEFRLVFTPLVSVFFRVCVNFLRLFYEGQSGVAVLAESSLFEGFVDGMQVVNGFLESVGEGDNMYDIVNMYLVENMYRLSSGSKSGSYYFGLALNLGEEGARDIRSLLAFTVSGDDSSDSSAFSVEVQYRVSSTEAGSFGSWVGLSDIFVALVFWRIQFRLVFGVGEGKQVNLSVSNLQIEYK